MIEPEEMRRLEYNIGRMLKIAASDDCATFAAIYELLDAAAHEGMAVAARELVTYADNGGGGFSWGDIARDLGVTPQGARQRFMNRIRTGQFARMTRLIRGSSL